MPLRFWLPRWHWWGGAPTPLRKGVGAPRQCSLGSVANDLVYADVRLHIPMTRREDRYGDFAIDIENDGAVVFTCVFCFVGISFVGYVLSLAVAKLLDAQEDALAHALVAGDDNARAAKRETSFFRLRLVTSLLPIHFGFWSTREDTDGVAHRPSLEVGSAQSNPTVPCRFDSKLPPPFMLTCAHSDDSS